MSVNLSVSIEDTGELLVLKLSPEDAERAQCDHEYLQQAIQEELSRRSDQVLEEEMEDPLLSTHTEEEDNSAADNDDCNDKAPFIWAKNCTNLLLTLYEENIDNFESGSQRHNKIWAKISREMKKKNYNVTWSQCQSKLNGLKKTYRKIHYHHSVSGNKRITWPYYDRMDEIFGSRGWLQQTAVPIKASPKSSTSTCSYEINSSQAKKKRKASSNIDKHFAEIKEEKKVTRGEKNLSFIKKKRMDENFGSSGWVQKTTMATEDGPKASTSTSSDELNSSQTNKKSKAMIDIEKYLAEMKEEKRVAREEKQRQRKEMIKVKNAKIEEILKQKKEQHQEKMAMMQQLINAFVTKK